MWDGQFARSSFRQWKGWESWFERIPDKDLQNLWDTLQNHKIKIRNTPDRIWWGYSSSGTFNIKEESLLHGNFQNVPKDPKWGNIWKQNIWPKVATSLWLLMKWRILTLGNLYHREMIGPSQCHMCLKVKETINHLLDECEYASVLWEKGESIFLSRDIWQWKVLVVINYIFLICWNIIHLGHYLVWT